MKRTMWVAIDCNLWTDPQTMRLAKALHMGVDEAVSRLARLWAWAMLAQVEDGHLGVLPEQEIADIMRIKDLDAKDVVQILTQHGVLLIEKSGIVLADWQESNGRFIAQKRLDRQRKSANKQRLNAQTPSQASGEKAPNSAKVRRGGGKSTDTVPNKTLPNITEPSLVQERDDDDDIGHTANSARAPAGDSLVGQSFYEAKEGADGTGPEEGKASANGVKAHRASYTPLDLKAVARLALPKTRPVSLRAIQAAAAHNAQVLSPARQALYAAQAQTIRKAYRMAFAREPTQDEVEELSGRTSPDGSSGFSVELTCEAIRRAGLNHAQNPVNYAVRCLRLWKGNGAREVDDLYEIDLRHDPS